MNAISSYPVLHTGSVKARMEGTGETKTEIRAKGSVSPGKDPSRVSGDTVEIQTPIRDLIQANQADANPLVQDVDEAADLLRGSLG